MLKALIAVVRALRSVWLIELAGAGLIVAGIYGAWGVNAALAAAGVALVLKAFELEQRDAE